MRSRLSDPLGAQAEDHDLAAGLLRDGQTLLQSVLVAFVDDESEVLFFDPLAIGRDAEPRLRFGDLLDADCDFH